MNNELFSHPMKSCLFVIDCVVLLRVNDTCTYDTHLHSFSTSSKQIKLHSAFQAVKAQKQKIL